MALQPPPAKASSLSRIHVHTQLYVLLPNTTLTTDTNIHVADGIRTHNPSKRAAANPRLKPRGHWDRPQLFLKEDGCQINYCLLGWDVGSLVGSYPRFFKNTATLKSVAADSSVNPVGMYQTTRRQVREHVCLRGDDLKSEGSVSIRNDPLLWRWHPHPALVPTLVKVGLVMTRALTSLCWRINNCSPRVAFG